MCQKPSYRPEVAGPRAELANTGNHGTGISRKEAQGHLVEAETSPRLHPALSKLPSGILHFFSLHDLEAHQGDLSPAAPAKTSSHASVPPRGSLPHLFTFRMQSLSLLRKYIFYDYLLVIHRVRLTQYGTGSLGNTCVCHSFSPKGRVPFAK